jgi:hypothetical protein
LLRTPHPPIGDWLLQEPDTQWERELRWRHECPGRTTRPGRRGRSETGEMVTPQCQEALPHAALWPDTLGPQPQDPGLCSDASHLHRMLFVHCLPDSCPRTT